jgi:predicted secreted protein
MPSTNVRSAKGTLMQLGSGTSPETFTTIGQVRSIAGPTTKLTVQDITTHSTAGNWMEKLATLIDPGDLTFPINWDSGDTTHAFSTGLWQSMINLTQKDFKCILPASHGTLAFAGYVTGHAFNLPVDNVMQATIQITINGAITASIP